MAARRLDPAGQLLVNLEKGLLKWVLHHPAAVPWEELEEWAREFEDQELKGLMALIITNFREHGGLDHSLLIQQVEAEPLRKQICALALGEEEFGGPSADLMAADWRQFLKSRRLKKAYQALKERQTAAATEGGEDLKALQMQQEEIYRQLEALKIRSTAEGENG